uniref:Uncharacterized protein n=1 Tax=Mesocestoides corti TaxID=53468 RepID=A0A5K3G0W0_MESCO
MRNLAGDNKVNDSVLRQLWVKCLPANTNGMISIQTSDTPLQKFAGSVDKIPECFSQAPGHGNVFSGATANTYSLSIYKLKERLNKLSLKFDEFAKGNRSSSLRHPQHRLPANPENYLA